MTDDDLIRRGDVLREIASEGLHILDAAIRSLPARGVGVKPLVWTETTSGTSRFPAWKSDAGLLVDSLNSGQFTYRGQGYPTLDAAKAAAQADYEARILAALEPAPTAAEAREAFAWQSTTEAFMPLVTDARYRKFSPAVQKHYVPYRCPSCADAAEARSTTEKGGDAHAVDPRHAPHETSPGVTAGAEAAQARECCDLCGSDVTDMDGHLVHDEGCNGETYEPTAAGAREAALLQRAAQLAYEVWDDPEALAKAILALIGEKPADPQQAREAALREAAGIFDDFGADLVAKRRILALIGEART